MLRSKFSSGTFHAVKLTEIKTKRNKNIIVLNTWIDEYSYIYYVLHSDPNT